MDRAKPHITLRVAFLVVLIAFLGHEFIPHHHYELLAIHNCECNSSCCHEHGHPHDHQPCNILHAITNDNKHVTVKIFPPAVDVLIITSLRINAEHELFPTANNYYPETKLIGVKDQFYISSRALRAPPAA